MKRPKMKLNDTSDPKAVAALDGMLDAVEKNAAKEIPSIIPYMPALRAVFGMLLGSAVGEKGAELQIDDGEPIKINKADAVVFAVKSLGDLVQLETEWIPSTVKVNEEIVAPTGVRVIDAYGAIHDVMSLKEALEMARTAKLDLVEVNPKAYPPVCKIMVRPRFPRKKP